MLNKLKNELTVKNFRHYKNTKIANNELLILADSFTSYNSIKEVINIIELIDLKIYSVEHLNDNQIRVKIK